MTKTRLASSLAAAALLTSSVASAQAQFTGQADAPQWLKDRSFNEGAGVRAGDLQLHPGIAAEAGYDSNWFLRTDNAGYANGGRPTRQPVGAVEFRVTPSLYLSTIGPQRRQGDAVSPGAKRSLPRGSQRHVPRVLAPVDPAARGLRTTSRRSETSGRGGHAPRHSARTPARCRPLRQLRTALFSRISATGDPNLAFNRDNVNAGGEIVVQPGSGTLDWRFGYQFQDIIFENAPGQPFDNITNDGCIRAVAGGSARARCSSTTRPSGSVRTSTPAQALAAEGLVNSTPVRARIGLNGLGDG